MSIIDLDAHRRARGLPVAAIQAATGYGDFEHPIPQCCPVCGLRLDLRVVLGRAIVLLRSMRGTRMTSPRSLVPKIEHDTQQIEDVLAGACSGACEQEMYHRRTRAEQEQRRAAKRIKR